MRPPTQPPPTQPPPAQTSQQTWRSSDLSKHPAKVFADAERHPVTITRRDGESLVLMSESESSDHATVSALAAQLMSVALQEHGSLVERMIVAHPWMLALSASDQEACANDLLNAVRSSLATNRPHLAVTELTAWKETASAIAEGLHAASPEWLDNPPRVDRPQP